MALAITSEMKGPRFDSKSEIPEQAIEPMISHGNHMEQSSSSSGCLGSNDASDLGPGTDLKHWLFPGKDLRFEMM